MKFKSINCCIFCSSIFTLLMSVFWYSSLSISYCGAFHVPDQICFGKYCLVGVFWESHFWDVVTNYNRQLSSKRGPYSFCTVASLEFDVSWTNVNNQLLTQLGGLTRQHSIFCLDVVVFRLLAKKVKQLLLESEINVVSGPSFGDS